MEGGGRRREDFHKRRTARSTACLLSPILRPYLFAAAEKQFFIDHALSNMVRPCGSMQENGKPNILGLLGYSNRDDSTGFECVLLRAIYRMSSLRGLDTSIKTIPFR